MIWWIAIGTVAAHQTLQAATPTVEPVGAFIAHAFRPIEPLGIQKPGLCPFLPSPLWPIASLGDYFGMRSARQAAPHFSGLFPFARLMGGFPAFDHDLAQVLAAGVVTGGFQKFVGGLGRGASCGVVHLQLLPPHEQLASPCRAGRHRHGSNPPGGKRAGASWTGGEADRALALAAGPVFRGRGHRWSHPSECRKCDWRPPPVAPSRAGGVPVGMRPQQPSAVLMGRPICPRSTPPNGWLLGVSIGLRLSQRSHRSPRVPRLWGCPTQLNPQSPVAARFPSEGLTVRTVYRG